MGKGYITMNQRLNVMDVVMMLAVVFIISCIAYICAESKSKKVEEFKWENATQSMSPWHTEWHDFTFIE